jgi:hypothetical protein
MVVTLTAATVCNAVIITFDNPPAPGNIPHYRWMEQDFQFSEGLFLAGFSIKDTSTATDPYDGTPFLQVVGRLLTITTLDARPFSLFSVDLAEFNTINPGSPTISFAGTKVNGSVVTVIFALDEIIDGNGPLADFQTFSFPATFTNLKTVSIANGVFSMDNVQAEVTPEPGTAIFGFGLLAVAGVKLIAFLARLSRKARTATSAVE